MIRAVFDRLKRIEISKFASFVAILGTIITAIYGKGLPWQIFVSPQLIVITHAQLGVETRTESIFLNACTIKNEGKAPANKVYIILWSEPSVPFRDDPTIEGAEGKWDLEDGGRGQSYARIYLERIINSHTLTATVRTDLPITFRCQAAHEDGLAKMFRPSSLTLQGWDFAILISSGIFLTILGIVVINRLFDKSGSQRTTVQKNSNTKWSKRT